MSIPIKFNNDILIPRSILKKNEVGPRDLARTQEVTDTLSEYDDLIAQGIESQVAADECLVGR